MDRLNKPSFNDVLVCVLVVCCLLCTLSFRTTKEQASHLKRVQRSHVSGGRRLSFQTLPLLICFSSRFSIPLMATKVFNTSSAAHMKGPSHQRSWSIYAYTRVHPRSHTLVSSIIVPQQRNRKAEELWFWGCCGCFLRSSYSIETSLCLLSVLGKPVLWSAAYMGQNRQTQRACEPVMLMHWYQGLICSCCKDFSSLLFSFSRFPLTLFYHLYRRFVTAKRWTGFHLGLFLVWNQYLTSSLFSLLLFWMQ